MSRMTRAADPGAVLDECRGPRSNQCTWRTANSQAKEVERLRQALNRDRTGLAAALNEVRTVAGGYQWIADGEWGSYSYEEHTQETLRREAGEALTTIAGIAYKALVASGDLATQVIRGEPTETEQLRTQLAAMTDIAQRRQDALDAALAEVARLRIELARLSVCHVCGDCLEPEDARCEHHTTMEPGDLDDDDECGCAYCASKAAPPREASDE